MAAGQSRSASAFEALTSTLTGFILSVAVQRALFPAMGHDLALTENMVVASVFTAVSLLRGYFVRRTFNALRDQLP
jgi:ABC-type spermidine/putrescine transport system permease subunit II